MVRTADKQWAATVQRRRFTADEYEVMAKAGILHEDEPIELINGDIVYMCAIGSEHASSVDSLAEWFIPRLVGRARVRIQNPVRLSDRWEPEPDIAVVRVRPDRYQTAHPTPEDILLLIEVADSSLGYDQETKLPAYARFGVAEVWVVDIPGGRFEIYREPREQGYATVQYVGRGQAIAPLALADVVVPVNEILPVARASE